MSEFGDKMQHLLTANVFGSLGILLVTQLLLHWTMEQSTACVVVYVAGTLFLAALSSLRGVAHGMSSLGEGLGNFYGAFVGGATVGIARAKGVPTADVKDALKEAAVRSTVESINKAPEVEPAINLLKLNMMLDQMTLNANEGKPTSRDTLVPAYGTQLYWNLATHILKLLGIRKEKTTKWFGKGDSKADIRFIRANVQVIDDVVLVRLEGKGIWKRVDLTEAHFLIP